MPEYRHHASISWVILLSACVDHGVIGDLTEDAGDFTHTGGIGSTIATGGQGNAQTGGKASGGTSASPLTTALGGKASGGTSASPLTTALGGKASGGTSASPLTTALGGKASGGTSASPLTTALGGKASGGTSASPLTTALGGKASGGTSASPLTTALGGKASGGTNSTDTDAGLPDFMMSLLAQCGIPITGPYTTTTDAIPSDLSGPNWGLKQINCKADGWDLTPCAGTTVTLTSAAMASPTPSGPNKVWIVSNGNTVYCIYESGDANPGIYSTTCYVDAGL